MDAEKIELFLTEKNISIKKAMCEMTQRGVKIFFVIDENQKILGTLTDGDIRRGITQGIELTASIEMIMKKKFFSFNVTDEHALQKAHKLMKEHLIEFIPVLDNEGKIRDIITWYDEISNIPSKAKQSLLDNCVVIMAGGKGTRLDPFTKILPKPLIPLGEKPIVEVIMDRFYERGFYRFKLIINHKKEMIKLYFSENKQPYELELIEENEYLGTVGGLSLFKKKITDTFILTNCDTLLEGDYSEFMNWHKESQNTLTIIGAHKEVVVPYGVLNMTNGSLVEMIEKPQYDLFVNSGSYVMGPKIFDYLAENEKMDIDKLIIKMKLSDRDKVGVFPCWGRWFDVGQWDEYKKTLKHFGIDG
ncbi:MAG: CBS domain-containing protein [Desulfamplus sp.]|nr:CBS domain-containing protein [Desulfamplus sp.]